MLQDVEEYCQAILIVHDPDIYVPFLVEFLLFGIKEVIIVMKEKEFDDFYEVYSTLNYDLRCKEMSIEKYIEDLKKLPMNFKDISKEKKEMVKVES